jgi:hypothetical protein
MGTRKQREQDFRHSVGGSAWALSPDLLQSASVLLKQALDDRRSRVFSSPVNHFSPHCVSSLFLVATAFDAWLAEAASTAEWSGVAGMKDHALLDTRQKFEKLTGLGTDPLRVDLSLLVDVRNEVAHYLPRKPSGDDVPPWLSALDDRRLLITAGVAPGFSFSQRLPSYALAYWAWQVAERCVEAVIQALPPRGSVIVSHTSANFEKYRFCCAPESLDEYDQAHGISPTVSA